MIGRRSLLCLRSRLTAGLLSFALPFVFSVIVPGPQKKCWSSLRKSVGGSSPTLNVTDDQQIYSTLRFKPPFLPEFRSLKKTGRFAAAPIVVRVGTGRWSGLESAVSCSGPAVAPEQRCATLHSGTQPGPALGLLRQAGQWPDRTGRICAQSCGFHLPSLRFHICVRPE